MKVSECYARVNELLASAYTERGIEIWWTANNRNLGGQQPYSLLHGTDEARQRLVTEAERVGAA